jgi:hypothetical protein
MYQFSLEWFKEVFKKSLEMTNVVRPDPGRRLKDDSDDDKTNRSHAKKKANLFSREDRIDFLIQTFTQELYKRL